MKTTLKKIKNLKTGTVVFDGNNYHIYNSNQYEALPQHEKAGRYMEQWWTVEHLNKRGF